MCITYEVGNGLYVNATNRCSNSCKFCIRNNGDGAYNSDSLWLEREPTVSEMIRSIESKGPGKYRELVFCGYGEPSYRLREIREVALYVKAHYPELTIRINTNGQSDLINGENTTELYKDAFDVVSVSLNAPTKERYFELCRPIFGIDTFDSVISFAVKVKPYVKWVLFSAVDEFLTDEELYATMKLAGELDFDIKVRGYIGPDDN